MQVSARVYTALMAFEGLRLVADAKDGTPTLGFGHTKDVQVGDACTELQAKSWLYDDVDEHSRYVTYMLAVPLAENTVTQGHYDALVSFCFNEGPTALQDSHLLAYYLAGDYGRAAQEFGKWVYEGDHIDQGLVKRRATEASWFRGATA